MPVKINIKSSESANLAIGNSRTEEIIEMRSEGGAFTGLSSGKIDAPDAIRTRAKTLQIKLLPRDNRLLGRVFAIAGDPNVKNVRLPFVLTLTRQ